MRVKRIRIRNVLGIDEVDIQPGRITKVTGRNAEGKTSLLEALRSVIRGGHDATLLRQGEEEGEVVLVIDDDGVDVEVRKRIGAGRSPLTVTHQQMGQMGGGKTWLDGLVNRSSFEPAKFLTADPKERVNILLNAMPMPVEGKTAEQLVKIASQWLDDLDSKAGHALPVIDKVRSDLYAIRHHANKVAKEKAAAAEELARSLPSAEERIVNWPTKATEAQKELDQAKQALLSTCQEADKRYLDAEAEADQYQADALKLAIETRDALILSAQQAYEVDKETAATRFATEDKAAQKVRDEAKAQAEKDARKNIERLTAWFAEANEKAKVAVRTAGVQSQVEAYRLACSEAKTNSKHLTAALDALDAMKADLVSSFPIEGVEIRDGELFLDGVPYARTNTARRIDLAIEVAKLSAGGLGFVIVDGMEALDSKNMAAFEAAVTAQDEVQFVVAAVSDGDLEVTTDGE